MFSFSSRTFYCITNLHKFHANTTGLYTSDARCLAGQPSVSPVIERLRSDCHTFFLKFADDADVDAELNRTPCQKSMNRNSTRGTAFTEPLMLW